MTQLSKQAIQQGYNVNNSLVNVEVGLEVEAINSGVKRYYESGNNRLVSDLPPGTAALRAFIEPMRLIIEKWFEENETSKRVGMFGNVYPILKELDSYTLAFITGKYFINITSDTTQTQLAASIGRAIELELNVRVLREGAPNLAYYMLNAFKKAGNSKTASSYKQRLYRSVYKVAEDSEDFDVERLGWTNETRILIGVALIRLGSNVRFSETEGYIQIIKSYNKVTNRAVNMIKPTASLLKFLIEKGEQLALARPIYPIMVCKPVDWSGMTGGGYLTDNLKLKLLKLDSNMLKAEIDNADFSKVYSAINAVQSVPYKINNEVLDIMSQMFELNVAKAGLPDRDLKELFKVPENVEELKLNKPLEWKEWKKRQAEIHEHNQSIARLNGILEVTTVINIAKDYRNYDNIYFPHTMDFRGRMYPTPTFLNMQGNDIAKSLLKFGTGQVLNERGIYWLKIHLANTGAFDKIDKAKFEDRIEWVDKNMGMIRAIVADPIGNVDLWCGADSPFMFLAACIELVNVLDNPDYESNLPVSVDGTCNGLQHYAALLRDVDTAKSVNLIDAEVPGDIYSDVAKVVAEYVKKDALEGNYVAAMCDGKISRSLVKRPVMTTPYAVTDYGIGEQLDPIVKELFNDSLDRKELSACVKYLKGATVYGINHRIVGAKKGMDFIKAVAKNVGTAGFDLTWTTPDGFIVRQGYLKMEEVRIETVFYGCLRLAKANGEEPAPDEKGSVRLRAPNKEKKLNNRKQVSAVAPNYIHSLDATHLRMTVNELIVEGITNFMFVHDSYGVNANDIDVLGKTIRKTFVEMHSYNLLEAFQDEVIGLQDIKKVKLPEMGELDIYSVLSSRYFFA